MIKITEVIKSFGKLKVLKGINLEMQLGQCIAVIGPNGSGKTTLIKSILGMVKPDSGTITVNGVDIKDQFIYRSKIGYMPQISHFPPNMTIEQLISMLIDIRKGKDYELDEELIEQFKLKEINQKALRTLSGGTMQKVSAALAFLFNPSILILDEPTAGLDPIASEILKDKIRKEIKRGKLIMITSHIMSDLDELASHLVYLQEGQLKVFDEIETLKVEYGETRFSRLIARIMTLSKNPILF